nr:hypothetical protein [Tanacetum cinerariifolium]
MVAILEKGEFNSDFHPMVDFIAASPLRIETTDEGTHILATVDGIQRTVSESSLRRNLKLRDEDGIVSIPDTKLFENMTLMGPKSNGFNEFDSNIATALVCLATNRTYNFSKMIFDGMVKNALVKEYLSIRPATSDKEMELWVELKRMYEPDPEDQPWTLIQNFMHAPVEWKLYDLSGVHHVTAKDREIFMLVEKYYPLIKGLALAMISYKLQVKNDSQMAEYLIRKIYNIASTPRRLEMPLPEVCTANEEKKKKLPVKDRWQLH